MRRITYMSLWSCIRMWVVQGASMLSSVFYRSLEDIELTPYRGFLLVLNSLSACMCMCMCVILGPPPFGLRLAPARRGHVAQHPLPLRIMSPCGTQLRSECPLLKKLPCLKKSGDDLQDEERRLEREALSDVIALLWKHPDMADKCARWLRQRLMREEDLATRADGQCFKDAPPTIGQVCDTWVAAYIKEKITVGDDLLGKIKVNDPENLGNLFCQMLNVTKSLKLPPSCRSKLVLKFACDARIAELGALRVPALGAGAVQPETGAVDWGKIGLFGVEFEGGIGKRLVHKPSGLKADIDEDLNVRGDCQIMHNWSESKATLLKGRSRAYNVLKFFAAKFSQPQLSGSAREWNRLVGDAYARVQANAKMQAEGSIAPVSESFNDAQKQRAAEATKRAREELQKRKVKRETKRQGEFGFSSGGWGECATLDSSVEPRGVGI